jgi:hypothetical protein
MGLKVFITASDSSCSECDAELGRHAWITLVEDKGALCLACADLDHLIFLPSGDTVSTGLRAFAEWNRVVPVVGSKV